MGIALLRVDERLVHGQVTVGWGSRLRPDRYAVVDDALAANAWERELYRLAAPEGVVCEFVGLEEARRLWSEWDSAPDVTVVLARDLAHVVRLAEGGRLAGREVNLGGIYSRPGRTEVTGYLFLDDADRARIRALEEAGVRVWGQDLPGSPRVEGARLCP